MVPRRGSPSEAADRTQTDWREVAGWPSDSVQGNGVLQSHTPLVAPGCYWIRWWLTICVRLLCKLLPYMTPVPPLRIVQYRSTFA